MEFPILYKPWKNGQVGYWECKVEGDTFWTRAGLFKNRDTHKWKIHKRNNYGMYNPDHGSYRSPEKIAMEHAQTEWNMKHRNDAMVTDMDEITNPEKQVYKVPLCCVLAQTLKDQRERHEKYISCVELGRKPNSSMYTFPDREFYVEYKMDGNRWTCAYSQVDEEVHIYSRGREEVENLDAQKAILKRIYNTFGAKNADFYGFQFDGEMMSPETSRNRLRSAISRIKDKHPDNDKVTLHIFDLVMYPDTPYYERRRVLEVVMEKVKSTILKLVPTIGRCRLTDEITINTHMARALEMGFEGLIFRDPHFVYPLFPQRIDGLIKHKSTNDCEMRIISAYQGTDAHEGLIIFVCEDLNDGMIRQNIVPGWTHDLRRQAYQMYLDDPNTFIGKYLTITYVSKNEYGSLIEAVGAGIRDPNDISVPINDKPVVPGRFSHMGKTEVEYSYDPYEVEDIDWD